MKQMLILTGPQGAGNHLWSKIFSLHPEVFGWKSLLDNYWEAHRFAEPFCEHWRNHTLLEKFNWSQSKYYFTSISLPLGIREKKWTPDVPGFVNTLLKLDVHVKIVVCGRDQNILRNQQHRLREESTLPIFLEQLPRLTNPTFLSYELLYLYKSDYLKSLNLNIPIAAQDPRLGDILSRDSNEKYVHYVNDYILDHCNRSGVALKSLP